MARGDFVSHRRLDGVNYLTATNTMIPAGTKWVFDHPFFIIMNIAVGGNWPGYPDATTQLTQTMTVDYVCVYQAPDTAERFEATFVDNTVVNSKTSSIDAIDEVFLIGEG
jgi:beta-glucanase (GH16 family)